MNTSISIDSKIQPNLFIWNNLGNAKHRTKDQQLLLQEKTRTFLSSLSPEDIIIFTDGSVKDPSEDGSGLCGAGSVIYNNGLLSPPIELPTPISSKSIAYHGELGAIESALKFCKNMYGKTIRILSDCQSAIQTVLSNKSPDSYTTLVNSIKRLSHHLHNRSCTISISWVGGHCNILGNELADKVAKEACDNASNQSHFLSFQN